MTKVPVAAHPIQQAILNLAAAGKLEAGMSLRTIGELVGLKQNTPQQVKHHLQQMLKYGYLDLVAGKYQVGTMLKPLPKKP